jgi:hypothetical protein
MEANTAENTAPTESAAPPPVSTFTEGRGSSNGATDSHDDAPMSLSEYRQGLRDKREEAEARATAKARVNAMTDGERLALGRATENPLYENYNLKADLDPDKIAELGLSDAPAPPADPDIEYQELKSKLDDLDPAGKERALSHLAQLQRQRYETRKTELGASLQAMQLRHQEQAAALQAQNNRAALIAESLEQQFAEQFPDVPSLEALAVMQQVDPQRAEAALSAIGRYRLTLEAAQQQLHQQESVQRQAVSQWSAGQDHYFNQSLAVERPDLVDERGRIKPAVQEAVIDYAESIGISRQELRQRWHTDPSMHDARMQRMMLDASQFHKAKAKAKEAKKAPPVTVQKPGEPTGSRSTHLDDRIAALESKGDRSGLSLREASKLQLMKMRRGA